MPKAAVTSSTSSAKAKAAAAAAQAPAAAKKKTAVKAATPKPVAKADDSFELQALPAALKVGSIRETRGLGEVLSEGGISSSFPIDDLAKIETHDRHAAGFRLDGGSLRNMWLSARRFVETDGDKGYELFFWLQKGALHELKERLEEQGAKGATFSFSSGDPAGKSAAGKAHLKRSKGTWSPSSSHEAVKLSSSGKYSVELATGPEALKGAMRIRVYGTDAQASKALKDVQNKLGLQHLFAPPSPNALERLKLMRLLWSVAPDEAVALQSKPFDQVDQESIESALHEAGLGPNSAERKAIASADLGNDAVKKRVHLAELLLSKDPRRFVKYVENEYYAKNGILPDPSYSWSSDYQLDNALSEVGIKNTSAAYKKAVAKAKPKKADAERILLFGLLAKKDKSAAESLVTRPPDELKLPDVQAALKRAGIDPKSKRVKDLRFEQVYPGYFTVIDPARPKEMFDAGARYLYSTADNVDRVWSILSSGQKASLTRFNEGLLIQGKSSSSDFGTGGAQAVFTRLVTKSVIAKAKKEGPSSSSSYSYSYSDTKFNSWGGSRPYKVILNREILARLDWWGFTGDNFGRSTGLTADNHGENLIKAIDKSYSSSNELMFPIGNDPAYVDFVVCETEEQKKALIEKLKSEGVKSWNGKSLSELVRVETKLFEHPDDA